MSPTRPLFAFKDVKMLSKALQTQVLFAFVELTIHRNGDHNLEIWNRESDHIILHNWPIFRSHMSFRRRLATHNISPKCCNLPDVTQPLLSSRNHHLSNVIMQSRITYQKISLGPATKIKLNTKVITKTIPTSTISMNIKISTTIINNNNKQ